MHKKPEGKMGKIEELTEKCVLGIEILLAVLIMIIILLSIKDLITLGLTIFSEDPITSYEILQKFLSHALLIVVGLELSLMLTSHSPGRVLEVTLYAIARKMLIDSENMSDILLGAVALAIVFAIDKYLHTRDVKDRF